MRVCVCVGTLCATWKWGVRCIAMRFDKPLKCWKQFVCGALPTFLPPFLLPLSWSASFTLISASNNRCFFKSLPVLFAKIAGLKHSTHSVFCKLTHHFLMVNLFFWYMIWASVTHVLCHKKIGNAVFPFVVRRMVWISFIMLFFWRTWILQSLWSRGWWLMVCTSSTLSCLSISRKGSES